MEELKLYKKVGTGLKIMFIAFLLRMVIAFLNIDDLGKVVNFFLEPIEKILILAEFLVGFVSNLMGNDIITASIYNSTAIMTFTRICVLCVVTGTLLRKEEEDGIYKHGMLVIGMYGLFGKKLSVF